MLKLTANLPTVNTQAIVIPALVATVEAERPAPSKGIPIQRDDEFEAIAMDIAMRYERSLRWTPFNVSKDNEHYDIRAKFQLLIT